MSLRRTSVRRANAALLASLALFAVTACAGLEGAGERSERPREEPSRAASPKPAPPRPLPAAWYEDPDGDFIPTAIEQRIGRDPMADDCLKKINCAGPGAAGGPAALEREQNTLLMLDSSGSMAGPAGGGRTKIQAAKSALRRYVVGTPDSFNLGFLVYGHEGSNSAEDKAKSCASPEVLSPLGELDTRSVRKTLARFEPRGYTPVAGALREARRAFAGKEDADNRIILVSDGIETCDGDPVAAARALKRAGVRVTVDVVGFDIGKEADRARLRRIAEVTGGEYSDARTGADLDEYFDRQQERIFAYTDQLLCLQSKSYDLFSCQNDVSYDVTVMDDVYPDERRQDEVERIQEEASDKFDTKQERDDARIERVAERLRREQDEAQRRIDQERELGSAHSLPRTWYARSDCRPGLLPPRATPLVAYGPEV